MSASGTSAEAAGHHIMPVKLGQRIIAVSEHFSTGARSNFVPESDCTRLRVQARISDAALVSTLKIAWRRSPQNPTLGVVGDISTCLDRVCSSLLQSESHVALSLAAFGWKAKVKQAVVIFPVH